MSFKKFTLIELLVVVSIIGILTSILLPSLSDARQASITSLSINNLKQIYAGTMMYVDNNDSYFCLASGNPDANEDPDNNFRRLIYEEIQGKNFSLDRETCKSEMENSPYKDIMFCPIVSKIRGEQSQHAQGRGDYSMNRYFTEYRTTGMITAGKKEPLMVTGTLMGGSSNGGSNSSFRNTVYGSNAGADYIYNKSKTLALFYAGNVTKMSMAEGAEIDADVNDKDTFE